MLVQVKIVNIFFILSISYYKTLIKHNICFKKYYYENALTNENITAKTNITWVVNITEIELDQQKKLYMFLCVDVHSNIVIADIINRKPITWRDIVKALSKANNVYNVYE